MTRDWPPLVDSEVELTEDGEHLWRQVAPAYLEQDGTLSSLVFRPMSKDNRMLSVFRESIITAKQAHDNRVESGRASLGTLAVSVGQVRDEAELRAVDNSAAGEDMPAGHGYIDFRPLTKQQTNSAAEVLLSSGERLRTGGPTDQVDVESAKRRRSPTGETAWTIFLYPGYPHAQPIARKAWPGCSMRHLVATGAHLSPGRMRGELRGRAGTPRRTRPRRRLSSGGDRGRRSGPGTAYPGRAPLSPPRR